MNKDTQKLFINNVDSWNKQVFATDLMDKLLRTKNNPEKTQENDISELQLGDISAAGSGSLVGDPSRYAINSRKWNNFWDHYGGGYGGE